MSGPSTSAKNLVLNGEDQSEDEGIFEGEGTPYSLREEAFGALFLLGEPQRSAFEEKIETTDDEIDTLFKEREQCQLVTGKDPAEVALKTREADYRMDQIDERLNELYQHLDNIFLEILDRFEEDMNEVLNAIEEEEDEYDEINEALGLAEDAEPEVEAEADTDADADADAKARDELEAEFKAEHLHLFDNE